MSIEREVLGTVQDQKCSRHMIDETENPSSLVLEYLDDNLLDVSCRQRLDSADLKLVARTVLEALALFHENGLVHTGENAQLLGRRGNGLLMLHSSQISSLTISSSTMAPLAPALAELHWEIAATSINTIQIRTPWTPAI